MHTQIHKEHKEHKRHIHEVVLKIFCTFNKIFITIFPKTKAKKVLAYKRFVTFIIQFQESTFHLNLYSNFKIP